MLVLPFYNVSAGYWGEPTESEIMGQMMTAMREQMIVAINSMVKMMAIKQATSTIESLLYGDNASPRNITNFQDFLINEPMDKTITYAQDFLTNSLRGTTSSDYTSSSGGSGGDELAQAIENAGQSIIDSWEKPDSNYTAYQDVCPDPSNVFADGTLDCYNAIIESGMPFKMALDMDALMTTKFQQETAKATLDATSSGTLSAKDENGNIILPSSMVEEIQLQRITMPLQALANADSNVFSMVIKSFVVTLISQVIQRGVSQAQENINNNMKAFQDKYNSQLEEKRNQVGPAMDYTNDTYDYIQKNQTSSNNI